MAALPQIRRLQLEDFKDEKKWISPLLLVINSFMEAVVGALNKGLTLVANTTSDVKTVTLSGVPTAAAPVSVNWTKTGAPMAVLVGNVLLQTGTPPLTSVPVLSAAVQVQWAMSADGKYLLITNVVGVTPTATSQYLLTLTCIAG